MVPSPVFKDLGTSVSNCQAHDQQIITSYLAQDVKEALLGGGLVSFKFLLVVYSSIFLKSLLNMPSLFLILGIKINKRQPKGQNFANNSCKKNAHG